MKSTKTLLLIFLTLPLFLTAQISLLPSVGIQIPMGDMSTKQYLGSDFGANLALKFEVTETFDIGMALGYHRFSYGVENQSNAMFPVTVILEKRFGESKFKPLIGLDLGLYTMYHSEIYKIESTLSTASTTKYNIGAAPTLGFCYEFSRNFGLHVVAKYNYIYQEPSPNTYVSMNIGLNIKFKKEYSRFVRF